MFNSRLINTKVAAGFTDMVDNYDPFGDSSGVALYKLDGDSTDESGNYNGTATNVTYGTGVFGQAGIFNGSNSVIRNSQLAIDFRSQTNLTMSMWVKTTGHTSATQINNLISFTDTNDGDTELRLWFREINGNVVYIGNRNNGTTIITGASPDVITDGNWHHIVMTADSSGTKFYYDGSQKTINYTTGDASTQVTMPTDLNQFCIGANQDSGGVQWEADADIDQVRIFNKALSASEVTTLYNEGI